eukprot:CAMPEP_0196782556 /NCGR_PEP_ID=MMETSP1104-20130614/11601_1 /TAXON_ID=33652 /ORGANISM="Cafeteria sp., Strain Caron Lab Isolate" /LENGTH=948 /DNA_ID=CAMNT_0042152795 /DNA_START=1 /DNA_END=2847 /DNA_ORIENTATION=+
MRKVVLRVGLAVCLLGVAAAMAPLGVDAGDLSSEDPEALAVVRESMARAQRLREMQERLLRGLQQPSRQDAAAQSSQIRFVETSARVGADKEDGREEEKAIQPATPTIGRAAQLFNKTEAIYEKGEGMVDKAAAKELEDFESGLDRDLNLVYENHVLRSQLEAQQKHGIKSAAQHTQSGYNVQAAAAAKEAEKAAEKRDLSPDQQRKLQESAAAVEKALDAVKSAPEGGSGGSRDAGLSELNAALSDMSRISQEASSKLKDAGRTPAGSAALHLDRLKDMLEHLENTREELTERLEKAEKKRLQMESGKVSKTLADNIKKLVDHEFEEEVNGLETRLSEKLTSAFGDMEKRLEEDSRRMVKEMLQAQEDSLVGQMHVAAKEHVDEAMEPEEEEEEKEVPEVSVVATVQLTGTTEEEFDKHAQEAFRAAVATMMDAPLRDVTLDDVRDADQVQVLMQLDESVDVGLEVTVRVAVKADEAQSRADQLTADVRGGELQKLLRRFRVKGDVTLVRAAEVEVHAKPTGATGAHEEGEGERAAGATGTHAAANTDKVAASGPTPAASGPASTTESKQQDAGAMRLVSTSASTSASETPVSAVETPDEARSAQANAITEALEDAAGVHDEPPPPVEGEEGEEGEAEPTAAETELDVNGQPMFRYSAGSPQAPDKWGRWYPTCGEGRQQSPVDIVVEGPQEKQNVISRPDLPPINVHYDPFGGMGDEAAVLVNNGHSVLMNYPRTPKLDAALRYGSELYRLKQFHFHVPSEHTVNGQAAAMEIQLVHENVADDLGTMPQFLSVALLYDVGADDEEDPLLAQLMGHMPKPPARDSTTPSVEPLDGELLSLNVPLFGADNATLVPAQYYMYEGSLTTPPCAEGVRWVILSDRLHATQEQVSAVRDALPEGQNARPVQNEVWRGGMPLLMSGPRSEEEQQREASLQASQAAMSLIKIAP